MEFGNIAARLAGLSFVNEVTMCADRFDRSLHIKINNGWSLHASQNLAEAPEHLSITRGKESSNTYEILVEGPGGECRSDTKISRDGGPQKGYQEPADVIEAAHELHSVE